LMQIYHHADQFGLHSGNYSRDRSLALFPGNHDPGLIAFV